LAKSLKIDVKAAYKGAGASASASMSLFKSSKFSSRKVYVLVNMRVVNGTDALTDLQLTRNASGTLVSGDEQERFLTRYGDAFIVRLVRGAELYALMEFSTTKDESLETLKASVKGSTGSFSASASMQKSISELSAHKDVRITYAQTGGVTGRPPSGNPKPPPGGDARDFDSGGVIALTPEQLLSRIREFPGEARTEEGKANAGILWAEILDYRVTENWPPRSLLTSYMTDFWALEDLGSAKLLVDQLKHDADDVLEDPSRFVAGEEARAGEMSRYSQYISEQMVRLAEATVAYPNASKTLRTGILPSFKGFSGQRCSAIDPWASVQSARGSDGSSGDDDVKDPDEDVVFGVDKYARANGNLEFDPYGQSHDAVEPCSTAQLDCPAAKPDERSVAECLLGGTFPYEYQLSHSEPAKNFVSLNSRVRWQYKTVGYYAHGSHVFKCNPNLPPPSFDLVVIKEKKVDIGRQPDACVDINGWCDSLHEKCVQHYLVDACLVSSAWHQWFRDEESRLGRPYDPAKVCGKGS
jgi:hypothetical protein